MSDNCFAAEHRGVGVDDNLVFDRRMPLALSDECALFVFLKTECTQGDTLVDFDMFADLASFADHDPGPVIDEKVISDSSSRVDIDSRIIVGPFRHHSRQQWNPHLL